MAGGTLSRERREGAVVAGSGSVWVVFDFDHFHGAPAENGSRNYAYLDGHVDAVVVPEE